MNVRILVIQYVKIENRSWMWVLTDDGLIMNKMTEIKRFFNKLTSLHTGCVRRNKYKTRYKSNDKSYSVIHLPIIPKKISEKCRTNDQRGLEMSRYSLILLLSKLKYISTPFIIYGPAEEKPAWKAWGCERSLTSLP